MDDQGGPDSVYVALTLLAEQGFDATSMGQIAAATGIPVEDVVRILGTKDAIVLTVARGMLVAVVDKLAESDVQTPLIEALMAAHSTVLADIVAGTGPVPLERMRKIGKTITSSVDLQKKVSAQRTEILSGVLADRFGTTPTDDRVQQGIKLWSAVLAAPTWTCWTNTGALTRPSISSRQRVCATGLIGLSALSPADRHRVSQEVRGVSEPHPPNA